MDRGFITPLRVEAVDACNWALLEDFLWEGSKGDVFKVAAGNMTDFASVPWWTQSILPRTGAWTKAAVLHDKMCEELNAHYRMPKVVGVPVFSSIDTDAIFRKNARRGGTDPIRAELLWLGVRYGALFNPARRGDWLRTAPRVLADTVAVFAFLWVLQYIYFGLVLLWGIAF